VSRGGQPDDPATVPITLRQRKPKESFRGGQRAGKSRGLREARAVKPTSSLLHNALDAARPPDASETRARVRTVSPEKRSFLRQSLTFAGLCRRHVTIVDKEGTEHEFEVADGDNLLDIAQANDLEMEGRLSRWLSALRTRGDLRKRGR